MNPTQLPAPPELPRRRHDEIRAELLRTVYSHRRSSKQWWVAPAVGASTAVVVGAVVVGTAVWPSDESNRISPADQSGLRTPMFKDADQNRDRFEAQCREALREESGSLREHVRLPADKTERDQPYRELNQARPDANEFRIFNYVSSASSGEFAVLYADGVSADCGRLAAWDRPMVGPVDGADHWLAGHVAPGSTHRDTNAHHITVAGQISAKVERVTVTFGTDTVEAQIANYTYIAVSDAMPANSDDIYPTVRAYDADGNLLNEWRNKAKDDCWITPDGKHLSGYDDTPDDECLPAPKWPMAK